MRIFGILLSTLVLMANYLPPAGQRYAVRGADGGAILPGGRVIQPFGQQFPTGPGPFGLAVSETGQSIATANLGPERASVTFLNADRKGEWTLHNVFTTSTFNKENDFHSISSGIAFANEKQIWISEGASGRVRLVDVNTGARKRILDLNTADISNGFAEGLAYDEPRGLLFVLDKGHSRMVVFDAKHGSQMGSVDIGLPPHSISLSPDGLRAWVSNGGAESSSVCAIDLKQPESLKVIACVPTPGPSRVLATEKAVFVSSAREDSIEVIDPEMHAIEAVIPIRIPGLESLRGVVPMGMALDEPSHRLVVSEAGLNAVCLIDTTLNRVVGHIPVGWAPTAVATRDGEIIVTNAQGRGTGPSSVLIQPDGADFAGVMRRGSVSRFAMPDGPTLAKQTGLVFAANGFFPGKDQPELKPPIRYVVLIVKGSRTFDDVLGDMKAAGTAVAGVGRLAIYGAAGYADGGKGRFSLHNVNMTPNQHALAQQFAFSDNFYADSESSSENNQWLTGNFPNLGPEKAGSIWSHLEKFHIPFRRFEDPGANVTDQARAEKFISEVSKQYVDTKEPLPRFLFVVLPNDSTANPSPERGYPYRASYVADNDVALGKVVDFLSHTPWWREMAIFVTESGTEGGRDHIDAHRTFLLGIGPFFRKGYVSHTNASYPALLKTVFHLLQAPSLNLFDATAADLNDMFTDKPSFEPYTSIGTDPLLFNPR